MGPLGRRQEAAKRTRENIVRAAEQLHQQRGLANVSVDEIVEEAGVSKGSFYVYFKRKEDVAPAIAFRRFDALKAELEQLPGTAVEKLGRFLAGSVRCIQEQGLPICKEWMKSAVSPADTHGPGMAKLAYDRSYITQALERAREAGELAGDADAERLAAVILAEYYGSVTLWSMTDGAFPMCEHMGHFADTLSAMLERYK